MHHRWGRPPTKQIAPPKLREPIRVTPPLGSCRVIKKPPKPAHWIQTAPEYQAGHPTPSSPPPIPHRPTLDTRRHPPAMAPKKNARDRATTPTPALVAQEAAPPAPPKPSKTSTSKGSRANWDEVLLNIHQHYVKETPQRTKLIDVFLFFLVVVGGLQFLYCVLAGNYVRCPPLPLVLLRQKKKKIHNR